MDTLDESERSSYVPRYSGFNLTGRPRLQLSTYVLTYVLFYYFYFRRFGDERKNAIHWSTKLA